MLAGGAQPAEHLAYDTAPAAYAKAFAVVQEHGEHGTAAALPQVARLDVLSGDRTPSPCRRDAAAPRPGASRTVQSTDSLQNERNEARLVTAAIQNGVGALAQLPFGVSV